MQGFYFFSRIIGKYIQIPVSERERLIRPPGIKARPGGIRRRLKMKKMITVGAALLLVLVMGMPAHAAARPLCLKASAPRAFCHQRISHENHTLRYGGGHCAFPGTEEGYCQEPCYGNGGVCEEVPCYENNDACDEMPCYGNGSVFSEGGSYGNGSSGYGYYGGGNGNAGSDYSTGDYNTGHHGSGHHGRGCH